MMMITISNFITIVMIATVINAFHLNTITKFKNIIRTNSLVMLRTEYLAQISDEITKSTGKKFTATKFNGGFGGGGGATVGTVIDATTNQEYFMKIGNLYDYNMLNAEYNGNLDICNTNTISAPKPICIGSTDYNSYVVFEKLSFGGRGDPKLKGKKLAELHMNYSPNNQYGWRMDNTCGATHQPNGFTETWSEFWDKYRLGHMLELAKRDGATFTNELQLREKVKSILDAHPCKPSLVHGDLWSGNHGYLTNGEPVIFDPAVYVSIASYFQL